MNDDEDDDRMIDVDEDWAAYDIPEAMADTATRIFCAAMAEAGVPIFEPGNGYLVVTFDPSLLPKDDDLHLRAVNLVQMSLGLPTYRDLAHLDAWAKWKGLM